MVSERVLGTPHCQCFPTQSIPTRPVSKSNFRPFGKDFLEKKQLLVRRNYAHWFSSHLPPSSHPLPSSPILSHPPPRWTPQSDRSGRPSTNLPPDQCGLLSYCTAAILLPGLMEIQRCTPPRIGWLRTKNDQNLWFPVSDLIELISDYCLSVKWCMIPRNPFFLNPPAMENLSFSSMIFPPFGTSIWLGDFPAMFDDTEG